MKDVSEGRKSKIEMTSDEIIFRMARAWARKEGESEEFDLGDPDINGGVTGEIRSEYMSDMRSIMREARVSSLLPLAEILARSEAKEIGESSDIEEVESFIVERMTDISRIDGQLERWKEGQVRNRDEIWASQARRAVEAKTNEVAFARRMVLRLVRKNLMAEIIAAHARQIAEMADAKKVQKERYARQITRDNQAMKAVMTLIEKKCPELLDEAVKVRDETQDRYR